MMHTPENLPEDTQCVWQLEKGTSELEQNKVLVGMD